MSEIGHSIAVCFAVAFTITLVLSLLLAITQRIMIMSGTGWMQVFGYSWEFDQGAAFGGTYSEKPHFTSVLNSKYNRHYADGISLMTISLCGFFGSLILLVMSFKVASSLAHVII